MSGIEGIKHENGRNKRPLQLISFTSLWLRMKLHFYKFPIEHEINVGEANS